MKLYDIAFNNLRRRKSKTVFLVIGMMIGIATIVMIYTITEASQADIEKKIDEFGANIMITPKSNTLSMSYGGIAIPGARYDVREIHEKEIEDIWKIKNRENLSIVSPKILGAADFRGEIIPLVGADLVTEIRLKKWWSFTPGTTIELERTREPSPIDPHRTIVKTGIRGLKDDDVIIGHNIALQFKIKAGDSFDISRDGKRKTLSVKGVIMETGSQDDSIIFMNLAAAQDFLGKKGKISIVEVAALCAGCPVEELADQINGVLQNGRATPIKQVVEQRMHALRRLSLFGFILGIVILLVGVLVVFITMSASVNERKRDIGIFRALGFRKSHIIRIILIEAVILGFIAGVLGSLFGFSISHFVNRLIIQGEIRFNGLLLAGSAILAAAIGTGASVIPAIRGSRIDPAIALREL
ncbi:MAG: ABC transporter permease [Spirochaetales bacterium]|nr:ABC transporter permease [Spirochaetales bacterium]